MTKRASRSLPTPARFLALALLLVLAARATASTRPTASAGIGVTPAGQIWTSDGKHVVLRALDGEERGRYALGADERNLLSVGDDGQRVTSAWPSGVRESYTYPPKAPRSRLVFRDAAGGVLRTLEPEGLASAPAFLGADAFYVRDEKGAFVLYRAGAAEGETVLVKAPRKRIASETGREEGVTVHASSAGVLVEFRGPYRSAYLGVDGSLLLPDPAIDCGSWQSSIFVSPGREKTLVRLRFGEGKNAAARLEGISKDGRLLSSVEIPARGRGFPMPGDRVLFLEPAEAVLFDDRGNEVQRATIAADPAMSVAAAVRLAAAQRKFEGAERKPTGADWVELALAAGNGSFEGLGAVVGDVDGAVRRLAAIPDEDPDVDAGRNALASMIRGLPYVGRWGRSASGAPPDPKPVGDAKAKLIEKLDEIAPGAPEWLRRAAAPLVLSARRGAAGPWALEAYVDAVWRGEPITERLPASLLTPELAERIALLDRVRLDAVDRGHQATSPNAPGAGHAALGFGTAPEGFHISPAAFPETLFHCLIGAGPARFLAAVDALLGPGRDAARAFRPPPPGFDPNALGDDEELDAAPAPANDGERVDAFARVAVLVGSAARSEDADLRAAAQLLSPYYGRPLESAGFRRDVLPRPEMTALAAAALLADRSLTADAWTKLLGELLAEARRRSARPAACIEILDPAKFAERMGEEDFEAFDPYCALLMLVASGGEMRAGRGEGGPPTGRAAELAALTRSAAAPPEIRLYGKLARMFTGEASSADALEIWAEAELPAAVRLLYLSALFRNEGQKPNAKAIAPELLRSLREGRLAARDEMMLAATLGEVEPESVAAIAAERLVAGKLSFQDASSAEAWLSGVKPGTVAAEPRLRAALEKLLEDEHAGPSAARVLAKTGVPAALKPLVFALKTGCFG